MDQVAVTFAQQRYGDRLGVKFECRSCEAADIEAHSPTHVIMAGLLHHLRDGDAVELLRLAQASSRLQRIVTQDIVYLPGEVVNNLFARLDRGRHCREPGSYDLLAAKAGLHIVESARIRSHPVSGRAIYHVMVLEPQRII
jgi:hypothetical protein